MIRLLSDVYGPVQIHSELKSTPKETVNESGYSAPDYEQCEKGNPWNDPSLQHLIRAQQ
jgi:hypothetical protein